MPNAIKRTILVAVLALLTVLFFIGGPAYHSSRSFKAFWNLGHIVFYALLAITIFTFSPSKLRSLRIQIAITTIATLVLGLMVEILQPNFERIPDTGDLYRNIIGALFGFFFLLPLKTAVPKKALRLFQTVTLLLIALQVYPLATALTDEYLARNRFPILSNFETSFETQRWYGNANFTMDNSVSHTGRNSMRVVMGTDKYSGIALHHFPGDWSGYNHLQFNVFNPSSQSLAITCRIHDQAHTQGMQAFQDRFNQHYTLHQGWNTIAIDLSLVESAPVNRKMDLSKIQNLGIFATQLSEPRTIYVDDVLLKKD